MLLIGESPPTGGDFFYAGNSDLLRCTQAAFERGLGWNHESPSEFLDNFKSIGCYLDDLCHSPIDKLAKQEKELRWRRSVGPLATRIKCLAPDNVVVIIKQCSDEIVKAARRAKYKGDIPILPFPGHWPKNRERYIEELSRILRSIDWRSTVER